ncbi:UNVERIFIED_CONTAM: hypothetical protein Sangu_2375900 [Sesamum angustifolium]|uniref:Uncharacterized protein n=1 Tax=Sesamum angustifolium TaxID=2727405 RepID=A0AAW2KW21_9LAMI
MSCNQAGQLIWWLLSIAMEGHLTWQNSQLLVALTWQPSEHCSDIIGNAVRISIPGAVTSSTIWEL